LTIYAGIGGLYLLFNTFNDSRNHLIEWNKQVKQNKIDKNHNKSNLQVATTGAYQNLLDNTLRSIMWLPDLFIYFIPSIAYLTTKNFWKGGNNNNNDNDDNNNDNNEPMVNDIVNNNDKKSVVI
jgi:hypothetical protein